MGTLPPNTIFYSDIASDNVTAEIRHIDPNGANDALFGTLGAQFAAFGPNSAPDAAANAKVVFAFQPVSGGNYGIYSNSSLTNVGAKTLLSPTFSNVFGIQVTPNGHTVIFNATQDPDPTPHLYETPIGGSTAVILDDAEDFTLSPDGNRAVYTKLNPDFGDIYTIRLDGTGMQQITNTPNLDERQPSYSRDGSKIAFSGASTDGSSVDLYTISSTGANVTQVTNTADLLEVGPSFNDDGSKLSYAGFSTVDPALSGVYTVNSNAAGSTASRVLVKASSTILSTTYWTSLLGRSRSRLTLDLQLRRPRK